MHLDYTAQVIFCSLMLESQYSALLPSSQHFAIGSSGMPVFQKPPNSGKCPPLSPRIHCPLPSGMPTALTRPPHHRPPAVNFQIPPSSTSDLYFKAHLRSAASPGARVIPWPWRSNSTTDQSTSLYLPREGSLLEKGFRTDTHMVLGAQIHLCRPATK